MHNVTMLGSGLIGMFYTQTLHSLRSRDRVGKFEGRRLQAGFVRARNGPVVRRTLGRILSAF